MDKAEIILYNRNNDQPNESNPIMKRLQRILALVLAFLLCAVCIAACTDAAPTPVTALTKSAKEIADAVCAAADFSGAAFAANDETDADLVLMFSYAIDTDEMLGAIEDYVLSTQITPDYPKFFSVIRVKEGTDPAVVAAIAEAVRAGYPQHNISQMVEYNPSGLPIAQAFTVKTYDNGVIVTAHGENGNDDIIALAEEVCRTE